MRSRCAQLIQQLPTHKLEQRDRRAGAVKNSFFACPEFVYLWLLTYSLLLVCTFNLRRRHKWFISEFQILKACINFIYHLQKQEAKTKLQTIKKKKKNLQLCRSQSQEKTRDFLLLILGSHASIYEMNMWRLKPRSFICNWFSIIAVISAMAISHKKVKNTLFWWLCASLPLGKQYFLIYV